MQIHTLKLNHPGKKKKNMGRGGKKGTYSGRGNKGQKARSGAHVDPLFEGGRSTLIDHMKKKRGFKSLFKKALVIDLAKIEKNFKDGEMVDREALIKAGLIGKMKSATHVKILGKSTSKKKFIFGKEVTASASASESFSKKEEKKTVEKKKEK
jgi:large subunit ribosomal protein L15